ncbi:FAD/NAD(P)-binding protein [Luteolibacter algae]|uniref:FAD/NAD(P)-binding protein n=1 Tax=Luteolibacter algae TaxID=454151 RepID=A0ABW5DBE4_9BACT
MKKLGRLGVIGSGPSTVYVLKHLIDSVDILGGGLESLTIYERDELMGYGMPFNPQTTDRYNLSNIASEEIPELPESLFEWLSGQDAELLEGWGIRQAELTASEVYPRLALGGYFHEQYRKLVSAFSEAGIQVTERPCCEVSDIKDFPDEGRVRVFTENGEDDYDTLIVATGHSWGNEDRTDEGYYASPWPIFKILPGEGSYYNFTVGMLGASLSAFDVVSSLAHRHGEFLPDGDGFRYQLHEGAEGFRLAMHSSEGWLPHLQWDQVEPMREIYRHTTREQLFGLLNEKGFLRLETYFNQVCRPALIKAFALDGMGRMVDLLNREDFDFDDFVEEMSVRHDYVDSFEGMRKEMAEAKDSVENHRPIHWKEVLDDLMYCLNYHAEILPAGDHLFLRKTVMPFLMNVIAAMPLQSGQILLALNDAGILDLVEGRVTVDKKASSGAGCTMVKVENGNKTSEIAYRMYVDCSGQKPMELHDYPFLGLAQAGTVRSARAPFLSAERAARSHQSNPDLIFYEKGIPYLKTGGIDIDSAYRVVGADGCANPRIYDISFPHTSGVRPYSYGLQACSATAGILVEAWAKDGGDTGEGELKQVSKLYGKI